MLHPFSQVRKTKCCDPSYFSQVTKLENTDLGYESKGSALFALVLMVSLSSQTPSYHCTSEDEYTLCFKALALGAVLYGKERHQERFIVALQTPTYHFRV